MDPFLVLSAKAIKNNDYAVQSKGNCKSSACTTPTMPKRISIWIIPYNIVCILSD